MYEGLQFNDERIKITSRISMLYRSLVSHSQLNPLKAKGVNWLHFAIQV